MIPQTIVDAIENQSRGNYMRTNSDSTEVLESLRELGVDEHNQLKEFFLRYNLSGCLLGQEGEELLDLCSPTRQIAGATDFGRDVYEVPASYICLTSGEGEGFYLYSIADRIVYDVDVDQLDALEAGQIKARWESFYDLLEWYVS